MKVFFHLFVIVIILSIVIGHPPQGTSPQCAVGAPGSPPLLTSLQGLIDSFMTFLCKRNFTPSSQKAYHSRSSFGVSDSPRITLELSASIFALNFKLPRFFRLAKPPISPVRNRKFLRTESCGVSIPQEHKSHVCRLRHI